MMDDVSNQLIYLGLRGNDIHPINALIHGEERAGRPLLNNTLNQNV